MKVPNSDCYVPVPLAVDLAVGTEIGDYVIEQKLDEGGMATVYGAVHRVIGKKAAVKVMSPSMSSNATHVRRFLQEARAANAIGHPNIVDVFAFGELPDGRSYFMMEWLQGETLYHRMSGGRVPLDEALHIVHLICEALEAAHDKGIVHRDLKPANVFLVPVRGQHPTPKLLDFGVAKLLHQDASHGTVGVNTLRGQVVGTPEYISPEQALGTDVDGRSDLYALGIMLYELVLGQVPFVANSPAELVGRHITDLPPDPALRWPRIPAALSKLILGLLHKDPAARPRPAQIREVLEQVRAGGSPPSSSELNVSATGRWAPKRTRAALGWLLAGLAVCAVGTAVGLMLWRRPGLEPPPVVSTATEPAISPSTLTNGHPPAIERIPPTLNSSPPPEHPRQPHDATVRVQQSRGSKPRPSRDRDYLVDPFRGSKR